MLFVFTSLNLTLSLQLYTQSGWMYVNILDGGHISNMQIRV